MPNADQCRSKFWHWSQCRSIPINADQFLSMPIRHWSTLICIERNWSEFIGIDRQWSALRDISDQCYDFDRHWALIGGVLKLILYQNPEKPYYFFSFYLISTGWIRECSDCETTSHKEYQRGPNEWSRRNSTVSCPWKRWLPNCRNFDQTRYRLQHIPAYYVYRQ